MTLKQINPYIFPIKGDISRADTVVLYDEACKRNGTIIEFGVGGSTIILGTSGNKVVSFEDQPKWLTKVHQNIKKYEEALNSPMHIVLNPITYGSESYDIFNAIKMHKPFLYFVDCLTKARPEVLMKIFKMSVRGDVILVHDTRDKGYLKPVFKILEMYSHKVKSVFFHHQKSNITKIVIKDDLNYVNWNVEEKRNFRIDWANDETGLI